MNLKEIIAADVAAVFLNDEEFAEEITLTKPATAAGDVTLAQRLAWLGMLPPPDSAISQYDRLQLLGFSRLGENAESGSTTSTILGITEFDIEDELQGSTIDTDDGRRITRMGRVHLAADVAVTTADVGTRCDTLTIAGEDWQCIRTEGHDDGMQTIVIRRDEKVTTKKGRGRP